MNKKSEWAAKVAPAAVLLLFAQQAPAGSAVVTVPEPSTLALMTAGAAAVGVARIVRKRRQK